MPRKKIVKDPKALIADLEAAFKEFAKQMAVLEGEANSLVKKQLEKIDRQNIEEILKKIKKLGN
jgi:archaellum component FlaC